MTSPWGRVSKGTSLSLTFSYRWCTQCCIGFGCRTATRHVRALQSGRRGVCRVTICHRSELLSYCDPVINTVRYMRVTVLFHS